MVSHISDDFPQGSLHNRMYAADISQLRRGRSFAARRADQGAAMIRSGSRIGGRKSTTCTCLFVDIGGVLLSNGWDHLARRRAAKHFGLSFPETEARHQLMFGTHEVGEMTLDEYLDHVVFYERRTFTSAQFRRFMFAQSQPFPEMIALVERLKARYRLKIIAVSNEARELNAYRIRSFQLTNFIDGFVSSCFVGIRKPDAQIFRYALDFAQVLPSQVIYLENTAMFVEIAHGLGIRGVLHTDITSSRAQFAAFGLHDDDWNTHDVR